jgi:hypothetical protein
LQNGLQERFPEIPQIHSMLVLICRSANALLIFKKDDHRRQTRVVEKVAKVTKVAVVKISKVVKIATYKF